jgi:hypothetical protein
MENVKFLEIENETYAIIDHGNDQFTSMLKSTYDEMIAKQAEQSTPSVTNGD